MNDPEEFSDAHIPEGWSEPSRPALVMRTQPDRRVMLVAALFIVAAIIWFTIPRAPRELSDEELAVSAYATAKEYSVKFLRSPSSVKFIKTPTRYARDTQHELWVYVVSDAQNGFGAMIRSGEWVRVKRDGNDKWKADGICENKGPIDAPLFAPVKIINTTGFAGEKDIIGVTWHYHVLLDNIGTSDVERALEVEAVDKNGSWVASDYRSGVRIPAGKLSSIDGTIYVINRKADEVKTVRAKWSD